MNASKENAIRAGAIIRMMKELPEIKDVPQLDFVLNFIDAAQTKLPTEASYEADKQRRKNDAIRQRTARPERKDVPA
jgi:hypothetical protein